MRGASVFVAIPLGLLACAEPPHPPLPANTPRVAPSVITLPRPEIPRPAPLELPQSSGHAAWLQVPDLELDLRLPQLTSASVVAYGAHAAIAKTGAGYFGLSEEHGVVGPLKPPNGTQWIGFGRDDEVLAATAVGALFVSRDLAAAAEENGFALVVSLAAQIAWDASSRFAVAVGGDQVSVIDTKSKPPKVTISTPSRGVLLAAVFTREDGVLVATDPMKTFAFVSSDRGHTYSRMVLPKDPLRRDGAYIWDGNVDCPVVLGQNAHWWTNEESVVNAFASLGDWLDVLKTHETLHGWAPLHRMTSTDPPPPAAKKSFDPLGKRGCFGNQQGFSGGRVHEVYPRRGQRCDAFCIEPPRAPIVPNTAFGLFSDATCATSDAFHSPSTSVGQCERAVPITRAPTIATLNRTLPIAVATRAPLGCIPEVASSGGGVGVILCREVAGRVPVVMADMNGRLYPEGTIDRYRSLAMAKDGTILLHSDDPGARDPVDVRSPRPLGDPSAWRNVRVENVRAYRPWLGGAVVALVAGDEETRFSLVLDVSGAAQRVLVRDVSIDGKGTVVDMDVVDSGRVVVWCRLEEKDSPFMVLANGELAPLAEGDAPKHERRRP